MRLMSLENDVYQITSLGRSFSQISMTEIVCNTVAYCASLVLYLVLVWNYNKCDRNDGTDDFCLDIQDQRRGCTELLTMAVHVLIV